MFRLFYSQLAPPPTVEGALVPPGDPLFQRFGDIPKPQNAQSPVPPPAQLPDANEPKFLPNVPDPEPQKAVPPEPDKPKPRAPNCGDSPAVASRKQSFVAKAEVLKMFLREKRENANTKRSYDSMRRFYREVMESKRGETYEITAIASAPPGKFCDDSNLALGAAAVWQKTLNSQKPSASMLKSFKGVVKAALRDHGLPPQGDASYIELHQVMEGIYKSDTYKSFVNSVSRVIPTVDGLKILKFLRHHRCDCIFIFFLSF